MKKKQLFPLLKIGILALLLVVATACSNDKNSGGETVAKVEGEKISKEELYDRLVQASGTEVLNALIDEKIIALEIKKEKIKVPDEEVDAELADYIESTGGEDAFKNALEQNGLDEKEFKVNIIQFLSLQKLLEPRIDITDEEIEAFFEENKDSMTQTEQVKAAHILVEDEKTAKEVAKKIKDGDDFAALAEEYSTDASNAKNGGELGFFERERMVPEFSDVAFAMEVDEISDPVKSEFGYHIIHVTDKKEAKEATLEDNKEQIKEKLFDQKMQTEYSAWLTEVKEKYNVENNLFDK